MQKHTPENTIAINDLFQKKMSFSSEMKSTLIDLRSDSLSHDFTDYLFCAEICNVFVLALNIHRNLQVTNVQAAFVTQRKSYAIVSQTHGNQTTRYYASSLNLENFLLLTDCPPEWCFPANTTTNDISIKRIKNQSD